MRSIFQMFQSLIKEIVINSKDGYFLLKGSDLRLGFLDFFLKVVDCNFLLWLGKPIVDFFQINFEFLSPWFGFTGFPN